MSSDVAGSAKLEEGDHGWQIFPRGADSLISEMDLVGRRSSLAPISCLTACAPTYKFVRKVVLSQIPSAHSLFGTVFFLFILSVDSIVMP